MKKITAVELIILLIAGLVPLLWLSPIPNFVIGSGDSFPLYLNPQKTLNTGTFMWCENNMGTADLSPAFLIYQYVGVFFSSLGLSPGVIEIVFQTLLLMGAGFSMFYLSKVLYPEHELAPLFAGLFYMFNFFVLESRLNSGFIWTYAFVPLLMALFVRAVDLTYQPTGNKANKMIILFPIVTMVAFSFASINPTNIALMLLGLLVVALYELIKYRKNLKPFFFAFSKMLLISIPLNLWWLLPLLNVYFLSPQVLNSQVNVWDWSWTQSRSSFLNLFWFNGIWGWLPEYVPYLSSYTTINTVSNEPLASLSATAPILSFLVFIPFIVGASALLFKSNKSKFNAYIMGFVLLFLFLAKGLHSPLGEVNAALYEHVPLMNMFREPTSKFTMLIVLFMALLIGYAASHLANLRLGGHKRLLKFAVPAVLIAVFVVASFPMVTNPLETKTAQLPYSSYYQIPSYWTDAASWVNSQSGDYKVLFCPLDDFYQMAYNWGYSGVDQLFFRMLEKPVISTDYLYSYVLKPDTVTTLQGLAYSVNHDNATAFKIYLDLLNVKYILQRNDVNTTDRNMLPPDQMHAFLSGQPYLHLVKSFGELDIYEYSEAKPSVYAFPQSVLEQSDIKIEMQNSEWSWNFNSFIDVRAWANSTFSKKYRSDYGISAMAQENGSLKATLWTVPIGYENISSPLIPATFGNTYVVETNVKVDASYEVYLRVAEFGADGVSTGNITSTFNPLHAENTWTIVNMTFTPSSLYTKFFEVQILYNGYTIRSEDPWDSIPYKTILVDNVNVTSQTPVLHSVNADGLFASAEDGSVAVLQYNVVSPMEIVLTVKAAQPFFISTSQALDKSWVATVNGQQIKPSPLYLGLEGFNVTETGTLDVTITYQPQLWFYYCSAISVATLVVCLVLLGILFLRKKIRR